MSELKDSGCPEMVKYLEKELKKLQAEKLWQVVEAAREIVEILDDTDARKQIDSFTNQPLKNALKELGE